MADLGITRSEIDTARDNRVVPPPARPLRPTASPPFVRFDECAIVLGESDDQYLISGAIPAGKWVDVRKTA